MRTQWLVTVGVALVLPGLAQAAVIPGCPPPQGVQVHAFTDLPAGLKQALDDKLGAMALPGQPFNNTDVVMPNVPGRRGIFVWNRDSRWIVATEHGGRGANDPILAYDLSADGATATLVSETNALPKTVCATATALLGAH